MILHGRLTFIIASILMLIHSPSVQGIAESVMLVETPSTGVEVDAGSTVYYVCVGYDDEFDPPNIIWKFRDTLLTNDSLLVNIYTKPLTLNNLTFTQSILELCGVQVQNNGGYSCSAIGSTNSTHSFDLKVKVTNDTIGTTVETIAIQAEQSVTDVTQQTTEILTVIDDGLTSVAEFVSGPNSTEIAEMDVLSVVNTINSLLHWSPASVMTYNNSRFIVSFETIISEYAAQIPTNDNRTFNTSFLLVLAENVEIGALQMSGRNVPFGTDGQRIGQGANISIPLSLFQAINGITNVGVFYGIYNSSTLFPVTATKFGNDTNADRQTQVVSNVVAVTVGQVDMTFENLSQPVTIVLGLQKEEGMYTQQNSERCVSWDIGLQTWTENGCNTTIDISEEGEVATCKCNHLTNFAVLANVCLSIEACSVVLDELNNLNDTFKNLTDDNYEAAVAELSQVIQMSENSLVDQNPSVLNTTEDYFNDLATFLSNSNVIIAENVTRSVVQVISSLLLWQPENIVVESSSRIVKSFELVLSLYAQQVPVNESRTFNESSVVFVAERRSVQDLLYNGRSSIIAGTKPDTDIADRVMPGSLLSDEVASVILPNSLFQRIVNTTDNTGLIFGFYNETVLFPVGEVSAESKSIEGRQTRVGSLIASAIVGVKKEFQDLQDPVLNTFQLQIPPEMYLAEGSEVCVFWDFARRDWSREGCTIAERSSQQGIITCQCNHLTNFAVLVDICLRQDDCSPSNVDTALTFISYIGISISIVCLIFTIITLAIFKNIRKKDISKFHIQLSLAILLMLTVALVFVAFNIDGIVYEGCVTVSILLHYFTLVAVMWMGAEALLMFQKLIIVFVTITTKYIVTVSVICWSVPIIPVLIPLIIDAANGNQADNDIVIRRGEDIAFCFLSHVAAFWASFLGPLLLVMTFNVVIFICVLVVLIKKMRSTAILKKEAGGKDKPINGKSIVQLMIGIGFVMFLFGLTWLFAILTFQSPHGVRETFQILFTVLNSLQGFFIFIFLCVINSEARDEWKKLFKWRTKTSWAKGTRLSDKNSTGTSSTMDSKNIKCNIYALDPLPKDKQAIA